jgi:GNAT superfamily N-acetyltransferase
MPGPATPDAAIRRLGPADLPDVLELQARVRRALAEPALLADDPPEFFERHLDAAGRIGGVREGGRLVAFGVLGVGVAPDGEHAAALGLPPGACRRTAVLDGAVVDEASRGRGLHDALIRWRVEAARRAGCAVVLSTVEPRNRASWANLTAHGLRAVAVARMFGGLDRMVLRADLGPAPGEARPDWSCPLRYDALAAAFAAGAVGVGPAADGGLAMSGPRPRMHPDLNG